jgi:hypothetical protein
MTTWERPAGGRGARLDGHDKWPTNVVRAATSAELGPFDSISCPALNCWAPTNLVDAHCGPVTTDDGRLAVALTFECENGEHGHRLLVVLAHRSGPTSVSMTDLPARGSK